MDDEKIISLVKKYAFLYDKRQPSFKDVNKRDEAWRTISNELNLTVDKCKRRWNALRERFSRDVRHYVPSRSGSEIRPKWHLIDEMLFLKDFVKPRQTRGSQNILAKNSETVQEKENMLPQYEEFAEDVIEFSTPWSPGPSSKEVTLPYSPSPTALSNASCSVAESDNSEPSFSGYAKRQKKNESPLDKAMIEAANCFQKVCETQLTTTNAANENFGRFVVATLNEMSSAKQTRAITELTSMLMIMKGEPE